MLRMLRILREKEGICCCCIKMLGILAVNAKNIKGPLSLQNSVTPIFGPFFPPLAGLSRLRASRNKTAQKP